MTQQKNQAFFFIAVDKQISMTQVPSGLEQISQQIWLRILKLQLFWENTFSLGECNRKHALTRILYDKSIALCVCLGRTLLVMQCARRMLALYSSCTLCLHLCSYAHRILRSGKPWFAGRICSRESRISQCAAEWEVPYFELCCNRSFPGLRSFPGSVLFYVRLDHPS